jgi:hypothetical protein
MVGEAMNIIELAQECQLIGMRPHLDGIYQKALEKFAALVAAQEREECIKLAHEGTRYPVQIKTLVILQKERRRIADAIRARGTT